MKIRKISLRTVNLLTLAFIVLALAYAIYELVFAMAEDRYKDREEHINAEIKSLAANLLYPVSANDEDQIRYVIQGKINNNPNIHAIEIDGLINKKLFVREERKSADPHKTVKTEQKIVDDRPALDDTAVYAPKQIGVVYVDIYYEGRYEFLWRAISGKIFSFLMVFFLVFWLLFYVNTKLAWSVKKVLKNMNNISADLPMRDDDLIIEDFDRLYKEIARIGRDVRANKIALEQNIVELESARSLSERHLDFKEDFIKTLTHDIRTPINIIKSVLTRIDTETERSRPFDPTEIEHITVCKSAITILNNIINELFSYEELEVNGGDIKNGKLHLDSFFRNFENIYKSKCDQKNLPLTVVRNSISDPNIKWVETDAGKVSRIVENLLDNAIKFTRNGSVTLVWSVTSDTLSFMVKDTGIGIREDQKDFIFNKFVQGGHFSSAQRGKGRGLGLHYVKTFVETLGGTIKLDTVEGRYTHFMVEIPFQFGGSDSELERARELPGNSPQPVANEDVQVTAFIIDDSELNVYVMETELKSLNVQFKSFLVADIAYHALKTEMPDIIFIDYYMPDLNGDKLAQRIRENKTNLAQGNTWTVCVTADKDPREHEKIRDSFDQLITKPIDEQHDKLVQIVNTARRLKGTQF